MSLAVSYSTMLCASCASPLPDGSRFCTNCGTDAPGQSLSGPASLADVGVGTLTLSLRQATAGEYEIEREIGRGGMGVVYLATETQLRRRVAIKVLPPARTFGEGAIQRFQREARTAAALDHPNIIPIYRVSSGGELMWYSMKLLAGTSLDAILREKGRLTLEDTLSILDQVADALAYAHQHGVIHRDVKPGNIMLDERGRVTMTDFGIAKELQEGSLTVSGRLLGTPYYMSPEQYVGGAVSGATDQYSLAVVAYQCLSGAVPFESSSAYELLHMHTEVAPPPLSEKRPGLPRHVYAAIERALAKRPEDRFATVADFARAVAGREVAGTAVRRAARLRSPLFMWSAGLALTAAAIYTAAQILPREREAGAPPGPGSVVADTHEGQPDPDVRPPVAGTSRKPASPTAEETTSGGATAAWVETPSATLIVRVVSGWARIYVDGEFRGERPVHREDLPPGTHTLRLERPGFFPADTTLALQVGPNVVEIRMRREP
ncbi:MAG TPA: protein kinase [Gemmatimonadales bacterium]|nr:protein kinase [Gemmatimonadales bacterium]